MNKKVFEFLKSNNKSISFVESCTAGGLSQKMALVSGVSEVLKGGLVTYQDEAKIRLGVKVSDLEKHTAVSEKVARQMAELGRAYFKSDYSLATTGWAGPGGGTDANPVGTIYFAVCGPKKTVVERRTFLDSNDRKAFMAWAVELALQIFLEKLDEV